MVEIEQEELERLRGIEAKYTELETSHNALQAEHDTLKNTHNTLKDDYIALSKGQLLNKDNKQKSDLFDEYCANKFGNKKKGEK